MEYIKTNSSSAVLAFSEKLHGENLKINYNIITQAWRAA